MTVLIQYCILFLMFIRDLVVVQLRIGNCNYDRNRKKATFQIPAFQKYRFDIEPCLVKELFEAVAELKVDSVSTLLCLDWTFNSNLLIFKEYFIVKPFDI
jgi:hypothetical protein